MLKQLGHTVLIVLLCIFGVVAVILICSIIADFPSISFVIATVGFIIGLLVKWYKYAVERLKEENEAQ